MDEGREPIEILDIFIGIILLCALVGIAMALFRSQSREGAEVLQTIESAEYSAPAQRLSELTMEESVLCTSAASVIQEMSTMDVDYIEVVVPRDGVDILYSYAAVSGTSLPNIVSHGPTDDAASKLLSYSDSRCVVNYTLTTDNTYVICVTVL